MIMMRKKFKKVLNKTIFKDLDVKKLEKVLKKLSLKNISKKS
jgi:hypothetical protein